MTQELKIIASVFATAVSLIAYIPYLMDMFRGKNKPHLYTWISIFLITITVGLTQLVGGAGVGAIPTLIGAVVNGVILFYCFRFGTKDIVSSDKIFLAIAILGAASFLFLGSYPVLSLTIVTIAEVASFIPTFRKTRNDPYSESLTSYYFLIVKLSLILAALEEYNLLTASYSILWILVFLTFLSATYRWRSKFGGQVQGYSQASKKPLTFQEFKDIYSRVNRLTVEVVIKNSQGFLLTKRCIEPYKGQWHIPGGTVYFREPMECAVKRVAMEELGVKLKKLKFNGYIEYPSVLKNSGFDQPIGMVFMCEPDSLDFKIDAQSNNAKFFRSIPRNTIPEQKKYLEKLNEDWAAHNGTSIRP